MTSASDTLRENDFDVRHSTVPAFRRTYIGPVLSILVLVTY